MDVSKSSMQLAPVGTTTPYLTMANEEFISLQVQPIEDDTWIRTEQIVHMEQLADTEVGESVKAEVLKEYKEELERQGNYRTDPILQGMLYQEKFMEEYQRGERSDDAAKAKSYRHRLVEDFRRTRAVKD